MKFICLSPMFLVLSLSIACGSNNSGSSEPAKPPVKVLDQQLEPLPQNRPPLNEQQPQDPNAIAPGLFTASFLTEFKNWTPVLKGDKTFRSQGHGGVLVRAYLNPIATQHVARAASPFPMAVGSVLAKAVLPSANAPISAATRVYLMRKQPQGFDSRNGNWSYAVANLVNGRMVYDSNVTARDPACIACHAKYAAYDYAQTIEFYRRQR